MRSFDLLIGDSLVKTVPKITIKYPYDGKPVGEVTFGGADEIELAIRSACDSLPAISRMPAYARANVLRGIAIGIKGKLTELTEVIRDEAGKPVRLARAEVERAADVFSIAAEEATRIEGELLPLDVAPHGVGKTGLVRRVPIGPILAITPFNFPLNLTAHKVAPAIAAGNSIVVKPASQTPMSSSMLCEIARQAGLPSGVLTSIPCSANIAETMVSDPRFKMLTFTGSPAVGWELKNRAGKKKVTLELGGNAGAIVEPDADLQTAASKLASNAFSFAGQVCISLQRIFVHESIALQFTELLLDYTVNKTISGDPNNPDVICGPIIDSANADRIQQWIAEAAQSGAEILCGGTREGNVIHPTALRNVDPKLRIACNEVFGPVVVIDTYTSFEEAIAKVNDSEFGLQASVFTHDIGKIMQAFRELELGAVIHNDGPSFRVDSMPYGGTKNSGFGREGLRYAIEEMTEPKLLVLRE